MRYHGAPTVLFGQLVGPNRFGYCTDLIHFQQQTVASFLFNGSLNTFGVGYGQIISYDLQKNLMKSLKHYHFVVLIYLDICGGSNRSPRTPVILVERILNRNNWKVFNEFLIQSLQFFRTQPLAFVRVGVFEVQIVLS